MKVAIVTHFPKELNAPKGGVEAVNVNLSLALAAYRDLDIHVVTLDTDIDNVDVSQAKGVSIHRVPCPPGSELLNAMGKGRKIVSNYLTELNPDLVHAHDTYGIMVKDLPIPRVFTIHGFIYGDTLLSGGRFSWLRSRLWRYVETGAWREQPHIVSISPYVRERLTGIARGAIHDIENPISSKFFDLQHNASAHIVFSAAVISRRKNTLMLIKAFNQLLEKGWDAQLRLAGPIVEEDYGEEVRAYIARTGLCDRVVLLGSLPSDAITHELTQASIFALVSLEENSPMGIEEAMAVGLPVVTSNRCGMPYMVRDWENGFLVDPFDASDISRRMERILADAELAAGMGRNNRQYALSYYHPDRVAERTRQLYLDVVG